MPFYTLTEFLQFHRDEISAWVGSNSFTRNLFLPVLWKLESSVPLHSLLVSFVFVVTTTLLSYLVKCVSQHDFNAFSIPDLLNFYLEYTLWLYIPAGLTSAGQNRKLLFYCLY